jgi:hypothetical protein
MYLRRQQQIFKLTRICLSKVIDLLLRLEAEVHELRCQVKELKARLAAGFAHVARAAMAAFFAQRLVEAPGGFEEWALVSSRTSRFLRALP